MFHSLVKDVVVPAGRLGVPNDRLPGLLLLANEEPKLRPPLVPPLKPAPEP